VDLESAMAYCAPPIVEDYISFSTEGTHTLLNVEFHEEGGGDWMEPTGSLSAMLSLRDDLVRGDYRALYLAWLKAVEMDDLRPSVREPPVPPGLKALSPALHTLVHLLGIDETLVQVAAEASDAPEAPPADWLQGALAQLAPEERDTFLMRLAQGKPHLSVVLNRRLREIAPWSGAEPPPQRTVGALLRATEMRRERVRRRRAAEAEARRIADLEALARREAQAWAEVETLIERMQPKPYDEAVELLVKLRDLAEHQGRKEAFHQRVDDIFERYRRRPSLLHRLHDAGLLPL
jgi:hypothetical protein